MIAAIDWRDLAPGDHRLRCPACGRGPKDQTLGATVEHDGRGVAHCFRCGFVETRHQDRVGTRRPGKAPTRPVGTTKRETLSAAGHALWSACGALVGTVGESYLRARGCRLPPVDGDLRFHPALAHPSGYRGPALAGLLTAVLDRTPRSLHFTWIQPDGTKAHVDPPRRLLSGHVKKGTVCRLWPDEAVTYGLGIAEGLESALTLAHALQPVWGCVDAGNLRGLAVLEGIESITVAADNDPVGLAAAHECATRWHAAGREVRVVVTPTAGTDLNDYVTGAT